MTTSRGDKERPRARRAGRVRLVFYATWGASLAVDAWLSARLGDSAVLGLVVLFAVRALAYAVLPITIASFEIARRLQLRSELPHDDRA